MTRDTDTTASNNSVGVVAIGRNEGERLDRCLKSILQQNNTVVYVDSGSTDGSVAHARALGVEVVELDQSTPFTAARARNTGYQHLRKISPGLTYVQFIDGDCELAADWLLNAVNHLDKNTEIAVISGQLSERNPEHSIYNWLCEREWDTPVGQVSACGGIAMMRIKSLDGTGSFREDLIAGEEPELCVRLRSNGWQIWRIPSDMATHDANMSYFTQWWRRTLRSGYGMAQGAELHGRPPENHWVWESQRALIWGAFLPSICLALSFLLWPWGCLAWLIFPVQLLRQTMRTPGKLTERATIASFQILARIPEALGLLKFQFDRVIGRQAKLIEHK